MANLKLVLEEPVAREFSRAQAAIVLAASEAPIGRAENSAGDIAERQSDGSVRLSVNHGSDGRELLYVLVPESLELLVAAEDGKWAAYCAAKEEALASEIAAKEAEAATPKNKQKKKAAAPKEAEIAAQAAA